jgi:CBS domain-containing protein
MLTAKDIVVTDVIAISAETTVEQAIHSVVTYRVSGLPIVADNGLLLGVITEYALLAAAYDPDVAREPVSRHMTTDIISVEPDTPLERIADLFICHRIRRVFVVHDGRLLGLISRRDLLRAVMTSRQAISSVPPGIAKMTDQERRASLPVAATQWEESRDQVPAQTT